jgi:drug/metabolite transporter (DMT)-like permease
LNTRKKFAFSLVAFLGLALLSWQTLSNDPMRIRDSALGIEISIRFRTATLLVLGLLAALTTGAFWRATIGERREEGSKQK